VSRSVTFALLRSLFPTVAAALLVLGGSPAATAETPHASSHDPSARIAPELQRRMQRNPTRQLPVIVQVKARPSTPSARSQEAQAALGLVRQHGQGGKALGIIRGASGVLAPAAIDALSRDPRVAAIYEDHPVRRSSTTSLLTAYPAEVHATDVWATGGSGQGVTVAVLDSGIAHDPDLTQPSNRIVSAVNFADPLPPGAQDPGGHGTHVAGIIAGNGTNSNGQYVGIAPRANLLDVRVLDAQGLGRASSVIAGLEWVVAHKDDFRIRVVNLSFGSPATTDFVHDPIAAAVEVAWLRGIVVVTSVGNGGFGVVDSPGIDPHVVTVGALDDLGTPSESDDTQPAWTGWGIPLGSDAKPDVVAPGRRIVSLRVPGSTLDSLLPDRVVAASNGASYFRLSGTSMATGVVSGVVALLLEAHPEATPDQVKAVLSRTARGFGQRSGLLVPNPSAGMGISDAHAAVGGLLPVVAPRGLRLADAAAQALYPVLYGQPLNWKDPTYAGVDWSQLSWSNLIWDSLAWDNLNWDAFSWNSLIWDSLGWNNLIWDSSMWDNLIWDLPSAGPVPD
jgi:serine protease AprX